MTYYLILPEDIQINVPLVSIIGEVSFNNFWTDIGWNALNAIITNEPDLAELISVKDQSGKLLTINEFLTKIQGLKVIQH